MASPGNRHCANCIGTLSFPIRLRPGRSGPGGPVYVIVTEKKIYSTHLAAVWGDFKFFYLGKRGIPHQKMPRINTRSELE